MKPDREVLKQTGRVAAGTLAMTAVMLAVFAVIGKLTTGTVLGGLYTSLLAALNFFAMGLTVQGIAERAAAEARDDQELQLFSRQMESRMQLSRNGRMIALVGLIVVGIKVFGFDPLPTILPILFPTIVIRILQIIDIRRKDKN